MCTLKILIRFRPDNFFLCIIIIFFSCSKLYDESDLYGVWKGQYLNKELTFTFNIDRSFELSIKDTITDSVVVLNGIYELNPSKNPIPLSLKKIPQLNHPLHTIIEFMSYNFIKIGEFSPIWRLRNISLDSDNNYVLKRIENQH